MRLRVSASQLVLFAVGFLSIRFSATADTIVLPEPFFTNQFTSVEAWVQLDTVEAIVLTEEEYNTFAAEVYSESQYILDSIIPDLYIAISDSSNRVDVAFDGYSAVSGQSGRNWNAFRAKVLHEFDVLNDAVLQADIFIGEQLSIINSAVASLDTNNRTNVITSVTFGQEYGRTLPGGGCECPDYRVYLTTLQTTLSGFRAEVNSYLSWLEDFRDGWQSIISSDYTSGALVASTLVKYFAWDWSISVTNDLTALVTNAPSNPLWVSITNDNPIVVQLASEQFPLPVWVTNTVDVNVLNFDDLAYILTNNDSVEVRQQSELNFAESRLQNQASPEEEESEFEDVSFDDLETLGEKMQDVVSSYKEMFDTNLMPEDPPSEVTLHNGFKLGSITVPSMHWSLGGAGGMAKAGGNTATLRMLRGIRSCFRAMWFVGFIVLLYYCAAVDMLVGGSLVACCFGVLMGDAGKITRGIWSCWRLFTRMLGISDFD